MITIWLPNQNAVAIDVNRSGVYGFTLAPVRPALLIGSYGAGYNDNLYSFLLAPALVPGRRGHRLHSWLCGGGRLQRPYRRGSR